jgi:hypothetical protein
MPPGPGPLYRLPPGQTPKAGMRHGPAPVGAKPTPASGGPDSEKRALERRTALHASRAANAVASRTYTRTTCDAHPPRTAGPGFGAQMTLPARIAPLTQQAFRPQDRRAWERSRQGMHLECACARGDHGDVGADPAVDPLGLERGIFREAERPALIPPARQINGLRNPCRAVGRAPRRPPLPGQFSIARRRP